MKLVNLNSRVSLFIKVRKYILYIKEFLEGNNLLPKNNLYFIFIKYNIKYSQ